MHVEQKYLAWMIEYCSLLMTLSLRLFFSFLTKFLISVLT